MFLSYLLLVYCFSSNKSKTEKKWLASYFLFSVVELPGSKPITTAGTSIPSSSRKGGRPSEGKSSASRTVYEQTKRDRAFQQSWKTGRPWLMLDDKDARMWCSYSLTSLIEIMARR